MSVWRSWWWCTMYMAELEIVSPMRQTSSRASHVMCPASGDETPIVDVRYPNRTNGPSKTATRNHRHLSTRETCVSSIRKGNKGCQRWLSSTRAVGSALDRAPMCISGAASRGTRHRDPQGGPWGRAVAVMKKPQWSACLCALAAWSSWAGTTAMVTANCVGATPSPPESQHPRPRFVPTQLTASRAAELSASPPEQPRPPRFTPKAPSSKLHGTRYYIVCTLPNHQTTSGSVCPKAASSQA